jgi:hypothetical protein
LKATDGIQMNCESFTYYVLLGVPAVGVQRFGFDRDGCGYDEYLKRMARSRDTGLIVKVDWRQTGFEGTSSLDPRKCSLPSNVVAGKFDPKSRQVAKTLNLVVEREIITEKKRPK